MTKAQKNNKGGNKGNNKASKAGATPEPQTEPTAQTPVEPQTQTETTPTTTAPSAVAESAGTPDGSVPNGEVEPKPNKRSQPKNHVPFPNTTDTFNLTDDASVKQFIDAYGRMGENFDGGYETHFNNCGPMCRKGVERISAQGKAKAIAIFADCLAEDAALAGSANHGLPKGRSPEESERLLVSLHAFIGNLIVSKRAQIEERNIAKAAADLGVPVSELKALKARQTA